MPKSDQNRVPINWDRSKQKISKLTNDLVIQIVNRPVNRVTTKKSLGTVIDQYLLWDNCLDEICKKVSSGIGAIRRLKLYVTRETLVSVYYALVQPYLITVALYGSQLVPRFGTDFSHSKIEQPGLY